MRVAKTSVGYTGGTGDIFTNCHLLVLHADICDITFFCYVRPVTKENLKRHSRYQHDTSYTKCKFCEFTGNVPMLGKHKRESHEQMRECTDCDYEAKSYGTMLDHKRSKHRGMTFDCDECDKKLTTQKVLKSHKDNKHKGLRFKCPKCDYKATQKGNLKIHTQAMHENVTYFCETCSYSASTPRSLSLHRQKCPSQIRQN